MKRIEYFNKMDYVDRQNNFNTANLTTNSMWNVQAAAFFQTDAANSENVSDGKKNGGETKQQVALHSCVCLAAPWQFQWLLQAVSDVCGGRGGGYGLQQLENSPLSHRFVRFTHSFTSMSVLRGVIL